MTRDRKSDLLPLNSVSENQGLTLTNFGGWWLNPCRKALLIDPPVTLDFLAHSGRPLPPFSRFRHLVGLWDSHSACGFRIPHCGFRIPQSSRVCAAGEQHRGNRGQWGRCRACSSGDNRERVPSIKSHLGTTCPREPDFSKREFS